MKDSPFGQTVVLAIDLDDTLLTKLGDARLDYDNPAELIERVRPHAVACATIARVQRETGCRLVAISGRGEHAREATLANVRATGLPIRPEDVILQKRFTDMDAMAVFKGGALVQYHARAAIGDTHADYRGAQLARVPFLHARWIQEPEPEVPARIANRICSCACGCAGLHHVSLSLPREARQCASCMLHGVHRGWMEPARAGWLREILLAPMARPLHVTVTEGDETTTGVRA